MVVSCVSTQHSSSRTSVALLSVVTLGDDTTSISTSSTPTKNDTTTCVTLGDGTTSISTSSTPTKNDTTTCVTPEHLKSLLNTWNTQKLFYYDLVRGSFEKHDAVKQAEKAEYDSEEERKKAIAQAENFLANWKEKMSGVAEELKTVENKIAEAIEANPLQKKVTEVFERAESRLTGICKGKCEDSDASYTLSNAVLLSEDESLHQKMQAYMVDLCTSLKSKCDAKSLILIVFWTYATESDEAPLPKQVLKLLKSYYKRNTEIFVWLEGEILILLSKLYEQSRELKGQSRGLKGEANADRELDIYAINPFLRLDAYTLRNSEKWSKWQKDGSELTPRIATWTAAQIAYDVIRDTVMGV